MRFEPSCDRAVIHVGGYETADEIIFAYFDALERNPFGFPIVESEWGSVRYIRTKPTQRAMALLWFFVIDQNEDVSIVHVERDDQFYEGAD